MLLLPLASRTLITVPMKRKAPLRQQFDEDGPVCHCGELCDRHTELNSNHAPVPMDDPTIEESLREDNERLRKQVSELCNLLFTARQETDSWKVLANLSNRRADKHLATLRDIQRNIQESLL